jgi:hypothetical protein
MYSLHSDDFETIESTGPCTDLGKDHEDIMGDAIKNIFLTSLKHEDYEMHYNYLKDQIELTHGSQSTGENTSPKNSHVEQLGNSPKSYADEWNGIVEQHHIQGGDDSDSYPSSNHSEVCVKPKKQTKKRNKYVLTDRKMKPDGMRKKYKINHFDYVRNQVNKALIKKFPQENGPRLLKLCKNVNEKVNIAFNKALLEKTIYEIYYEDSRKEPINPADAKRREQNKETLRLIKEECKEALSLMRKTYQESLYEHKNSQEFKKHLKEIYTKEGEIYYEFYSRICNEFVFYYISTNANVRRNATNARNSRN